MARAVKKVVKAPTKRAPAKGTKTTKATKRTQITAVIDDKHFKKLAREAKLTKVSFAEVLRRAVAEYVETPREINVSTGTSTRLAA